MPAAPRRAGGEQRVRALDGLRGWASLLVVFTHVFSASLTWYAPPGITKWPMWSARWWFVQSPLHIFWAGPEMVPVFFILSGYVLTMPAIKRGNGWFRLSYFPRRLLRLYPTAWAAIIFAIVLHSIPAHSPVTDTNGWLNNFAVPLTTSNTLKSVTLLGPEAALYGLTSALWTMRWEVIFSMLLPLVIAGVLLTRGRRWPLSVPIVGLCFWGICAANSNGPFVDKAIHYLPLFVLGSLMAIQLPPRAENAPTPLLRSLRIPEAAISVSLILICIGLLTIGYWTLNEDVTSTSGWVEAGTIAGACMLVWLCRGDRICIAAMSARPSLWLGERCYSLYLVHLPIILSLAFAFGGHINAVALLAMSVALSLLGADILFRLIERPSIGLSRRVGRVTTRWDRHPGAS